MASGEALSVVVVVAGACMSFWRMTPSAGFPPALSSCICSAAARGGAASATSPSACVIASFSVLAFAGDPTSERPVANSAGAAGLAGATCSVESVCGAAFLSSPKSEPPRSFLARGSATIIGALSRVCRICQVAIPAIGAIISVARAVPVRSRVFMKFLHIKVAMRERRLAAGDPWGTAEELFSDASNASIAARRAVKAASVRGSGTGRLDRRFRSRSGSLIWRPPTKGF